MDTNSLGSKIAPKALIIISTQNLVSPICFLFHIKKDIDLVRGRNGMEGMGMDKKRMATL